jgi:hypothetical protein
MQKLDVVLESIVFEIRFGDGHLYFDRCGACLLDIERECSGWTVAQGAQNSGTVIYPAGYSTAIFNNSHFVYSVTKAFKRDLDDMGKEASKLWKIVQANLGIEELVRVGCRIIYYIPCLSIEEAERRLEKSKINLQLPDNILPNFRVKSRQVVATFENGDFGYRIDLKCVTRVDGLQPSQLLASDPKFLSSKQKEARIAQLKAREEYIAEPMYSIDLDVDCFEVTPQNISVEKFMSEQFSIVQNNFAPFLRSL